jgi:leader peptidase (prepilin peptidase)/N-methyltransferase
MLPLQNLPISLVEWWFAVLGAAMGSFLNVVAYRVPRHLSLIQKSSCQACGKPVAPWENIPIVSWAALRGQCSGCKSPIGSRYVLAEVIAAILYAAGAWKFGVTWTLFAYLTLTSALLVITLTDLDLMLVPDAISIPVTVAGIATALCAWWAGTALFVSNPLTAVAAAAAGYTVFWLIDRAALWIKGVHGIGQGDMKATAMIGAWLGPALLMESIAGAVFMGAGIGIIAILSGRSRSARMPFAPMLAGGVVLTVLLPHWFFSALH